MNELILIGPKTQTHRRKIDRLNKITCTRVSSVECCNPSRWVRLKIKLTTIDCTSVNYLLRCEFKFHAVVYNTQLLGVILLVELI